MCPAGWITQSTMYIATQYNTVHLQIKTNDLTVVLPFQVYNFWTSASIFIASVKQGIKTAAKVLFVNF